MFVCRNVISVGDLVARGECHFLVCRSELESVLLVPFVGARAPAHRADIAAGEGSGLASLGVSERDMVFAGGAAFLASRRRLHRLGPVAPVLLARVERAIARDRAASRSEASCGLGSNLVAQTSSSGRRCAAVRYA